MDDDILTELENKIESLFTKVQNFKLEKSNLNRKIEEQKGRIEELESENNLLKKEIEEAKHNDGIRRNKLDNAADKIRKLLLKLEAVEG